MKTMTPALAMLLAMAPLPSAGFSAASAAEPAEEMQALHQFCADLIASGEFPTLNVGECISFNITPESGFTPHFCDALREIGVLELAGFESYSDCIRNAD